MSDEEKKVEETKETTAAPEETKEEAVKEPETSKETPVEAKKEQTEAPKEESTEEPSDESAEPVENAEPEAPATPEINPGMIVRVHERIKDVNTKGEEKIRTQVFEGMVLGVKNSGIGRTMTVRKDSGGIMVEKIFPLASPNIENIEVVKEHKVRRAKLTYLRSRFKRKMKEMK